jgi:hypothetical protein
MSYFVNLLKKNPDLLSKYVSLGLSLVDKTVHPLNTFMKHLMVVQGIDPRTQPGDKYRKILSDAMDDIKDPNDFDDDFDLGWVRNKYNQVTSKLSNLHLNRDKFREVTDLSKVNDKPVVISKPVESDPLEELSKFDERYNVAALKEALNTLKKYAAEVEVERTPKNLSRQANAVTTAKSKKVAGKTHVTKSFKGSFRRVKDED